MVKSKIVAIKNWIKLMGFELIKSHELIGKKTKINYYSLGNFGVYEEISNKRELGKDNSDNLRFVSWNPWGIDFEVNSVKDLMDAYLDSQSISPEISTLK